MKKCFLVGVVFVTTVMLLMGNCVFSQQKPLEKVTFRLNWIPEGEGDHAIYYAAKHFGYYEDNGLDVTIEKGSGSGDTAKRVSVGAADIGIADTPSIAAVRAGGARVKVIAILQSTTLNCVWTRADTGIKTLKDLEGHTIGAPPLDSQRVLFPALAKINNIDMSKIQWVNIAPPAKIPSLAAGKVDATVHFFDQKALYFEILGPENTVYFRFQDYGVNPYGLAVFAHEDTIATRGDMLKRFLEASIKAQRWVIQHPEEAIDIMQQLIPAVDKEKVLSMLIEDIEVEKSPDVLVHGLGWISLERMRETVDLINKYFDIARPLTAEEMFTTEFLPHYSWPYGF